MQAAPVTLNLVSTLKSHGQSSNLPETQAIISIHFPRKKLMPPCKLLFPLANVTREGELLIINYQYEVLLSAHLLESGHGLTSDSSVKEEVK